MLLLTVKDRDFVVLKVGDEVLGRIYYRAVRTSGSGGIGFELDKAIKIIRSKHYVEGRDK